MKYHNLHNGINVADACCLSSVISDVFLGYNSVCSFETETVGTSFHYEHKSNVNI